MRFSPKAPLTGVTKEEKEARLKAFVSRHLDIHRASASTVKPVYRLLALSAESPAARALQSLAPDLAAAGIAIEAIFTRATPQATLDNATCRIVADVRFLDAHEQLVLDHAAVWIGDCMRRDPGKRDAFELFSDTNLETASNASRSFAQLWRAAASSSNRATGRVWNAPRPPALFDPSLLAGADALPTPAFLRH